MIGLYGRTHFELEDYIDLKQFDQIQMDIWKGIAVAKPISDHGYLISKKLYEDGDLSSTMPVMPLMEAYQNYLALPVDNKIKLTGDQIFKEHGYNALSTFLKYAYGAHDLCYHYLLWDHHEGWRSDLNHRRLTKISRYFSTLIDWVDSLITNEIFSNIGRAYIIAIDSKGHSFEHRDPPLDPDVDSNIFPEFIHIRPNTKRPFYVFDPDENKKHYVESRIGWWNDRDVHGGEAILEPSYAIRIDGIFNDNFRRRLCIL